MTGEVEVDNKGVIETLIEVIPFKDPCIIYNSTLLRQFKNSYLVLRSRIGVYYILSF